MYKKIAGYQAFRTIIYLPVIMTAPIMASLYKLTLDWGIVRVIGERFGLNLPDSFIMNEDHALGTVLFYMLYTGIGGRFVLLGGAMNTILFHSLIFGYMFATERSVFFDNHSNTQEDNCNCNACYGNYYFFHFMEKTKTTDKGTTFF